VEWTERGLYEGVTIPHRRAVLREDGEVCLAVLIKLAALDIPFCAIIAVL
jgi:hypothetical protein